MSDHRVFLIGRSNQDRYVYMRPVLVDNFLQFIGPWKPACEYLGTSILKVRHG